MSLCHFMYLDMSYKRNLLQENKEDIFIKMRSKIDEWLDFQNSIVKVF